MATWQQVGVTVGMSALAALFMPLESVAQDASDPSVRVRSMETRQLRKPDLRENNPNSGSQDWFRITTEFETSTPWLDALDVSVYALFEPDPDEAAMRTPMQYVLLRGQTQYVNVKRGNHMSEMYVHPNTLERYGPIQAIAVVFKVQGRTLAVESEPRSREAWWQQLSPVDGLILKAGQTPYNIFSPDHHEATKAISTAGR